MFQLKLVMDVDENFVRESLLRFEGNPLAVNHVCNLLFEDNNYPRAKKAAPIPQAEAGVPRNDHTSIVCIFQFCCGAMV